MSEARPNGERARQHGERARPSAERARVAWRRCVALFVAAACSRGAPGQPRDAAGDDAPPGADAAPAPDAGVACEDVVAEPAPYATAAAWSGQRVTLTVPVTGEILVSGDGVPVVAPEQALQPTLMLVPAASGFDVEVEVANATSVALPLGTLYVSGIQLGDGAVTRRPIEDSSRELTLSPTAGAYHYHGAGSYPSWMYSPVQVLSDGERHVGISLQYPLLEARHPALFEVWSVPSATPARRSYTVQIALQGELAPGQARRYVVSLRVAPAAHSWLATLVPYRNYFRARYGYTRYRANRAAVRGALTAYSEYCPGQPYGAADNLYGYADLFQPQRRPDIAGWGPWVDQLVAAAGDGFARVMLWTPTGVFCAHPGLNYPDQFVTRIDDDPIMATSKGELLRVPAAGLDLGLWWGRSMLQTRPWDAGTQQRLDTADPASVALALAELDAARALGATTIGLDAFGWNGEGEQEDWRSYEWLRAMQLHAPDVTFVTEGLTSDLVHTLAPTFTIGAHHPGPHLLADFLNPGHEIWGQVRWDLVFAGDPQWWDRPLADRHAELYRMAAVGLVPVVIDEATPVPAGLIVAETWRTSVPASLRSPCDPM